MVETRNDSTAAAQRSWRTRLFAWQCSRAAATSPRSSTRRPASDPALDSGTWPSVEPVGVTLPTHETLRQRCGGSACSASIMGHNLCLDLSSAVRRTAEVAAGQTGARRRVDRDLHVRRAPGRASDDGRGFSESLSSSFERQLQELVDRDDSRAAKSSRTSVCERPARLRGRST